MLKSIRIATLLTASAFAFSGANANPYTTDNYANAQAIKISHDAPGDVGSDSQRGGIGLDGRIYDPIQDMGQETLGRFVELMEAETPGTYSIQVALPSATGKVEYFWLKLTGHDHSNFSGLITNVPKIATQYSYGQAITVSRLEISDWMIMSESAIYGGYTMRPALKYFPKEKAEAIRKLLKD